ncbi:hypothetical protein [Photobacterium leiognathi]|uniref:hypothetical protein n=1 Tax=Photobacterium leiognathi TaxID=553611 RepID=UPI002981A148|nr:hypothetical protein [Photobacterium leiognathi]
MKLSQFIQQDRESKVKNREIYGLEVDCYHSSGFKGDYDVLGFKAKIIDQDWELDFIDTIISITDVVRSNIVVVMQVGQMPALKAVQDSLFAGFHLVILPNDDDQYYLNELESSMSFYKNHKNKKISVQPLKHIESIVEIENILKKGGKPSKINSIFNGLVFSNLSPERAQLIITKLKSTYNSLI